MKVIVHKKLAKDHKIDTFDSAAYDMKKSEINVLISSIVLEYGTDDDDIVEFNEVTELNCKLY